MTGQRLPVGVIGGIGPLATVYFLDKVVRSTEAERDQDHLDLVVLNHASIPDRTAYLTGASTQDPGPILAEDARRLQRIGVSFIAIPCNTAEGFRAEVAAAVDVPVLSIVAESVRAVVSRHPTSRAVGVLATRGTVEARVYQHALARAGLDCLLPDAADQAALMDIIYRQVKVDRPVDREAFAGIAERLFARGADVAILGCTELSVAARDLDLVGDPRFVDSMEALAHRVIVRAGGRPRADGRPSGAVTP